MNSTSSDKYNNKRKELLIRKDNNEDVSNLDLGFYDLTTYYNEDESNSLLDKILLYENDERLIQHIEGRKLHFMPEQEELLSIIKQQNRLIISAPTSFGKTMIVKEYIYREKPNNIVYIVPTNSLAYELESEFKRKNSKFSDYTIFDKNSNNIEVDGNEKLLFIGTQEKYIEVSKSFKEINLFIIDEAYKLQESTKKQRGFKLSQAFIESINSKSEKIVLLTPNARLIGFEKYNFYEYQTHFNAVDKVFHKIDPSNFDETLFKCAKQSKTILYCESPKDMVKIANEAEEIKNTYNDYIKDLENDYHPDWSVIKLMRKGILTHHGQMPKFLQNHMIDLFIKSNEYNLLIGTNSISEGINTPTKNLFFDKDCSFNKEKLLYKNTIGRAGRLGQFPIGHIFSVKDLNYLDNNEIEIELAISNDDELEEIEENTNDLKIKAVYEANDILNEECVEKIKSFHLPLSKLRAIFDVLSQDLDYYGLNMIPKMSYKVFPSEYPRYPYPRIEEEEIYIRGCLQYSYKINEDESHQLKTFTDKIDFFRFVNAKKNKPEKDNSYIIEGYMKFMYSTLEYCILPIMNVGKAIIDYLPDWKFGKNVKNTISDFFEKYYNFYYGFSIDGFSDNQKRILDTMKEYGISLKEIGINSNILSEIESKLKSRYSTFDVINSIIKLSNENGKYQNVYLYIKRKYISFTD